MKIGAHVSISGGLLNAITRASEIEANTIQIFASAPKNWYSSKITNEEAAQFALQSQKENIYPVFIHAIYLVNLASDNEELINKSRKSLIEALNISAKIKSAGVIFHIGSHKTRTYQDTKYSVIEHINDILSKTDKNSTLLIETNAGQGNCIGCTFEQIAEIISGINVKNRIGVCLDTAHVFASGYDIKSSPKKIITDFDNIIGLNYLKVIHCNDSKTGLNSRHDRHENIGEGQLGLKTFEKLLNLPQLSQIPFILEVPGFDNLGPDKQNIKILKGLVDD